MRDYDIPAVCSWVNTREALALVSGDVADSLTPRILAGWTAKAVMTFVVADEETDTAIGFSTLSDLELPTLPVNYVELCHLIVDPRYRYLFIGSRLCRSAKLAAQERGFEFLCGRIVPGNRYALVLARAQRFEEFTHFESWAPSGFHWVRFAISWRGADNDWDLEKRNGRPRRRITRASRC
jgi:ribosomal protein S18 acetylase RimI-like enzyme